MSSAAAAASITPAPDDLLCDGDGRGSPAAVAARESLAVEVLEHPRHGWLLRPKDQAFDKDQGRVTVCSIDDSLVRKRVPAFPELSRPVVPPKGSSGEAASMRRQWAADNLGAGLHGRLGVDGRRSVDALAMVVVVDKLDEVRRGGEGRDEDEDLVGGRTTASCAAPEAIMSTNLREAEFLSPSPVPSPTAATLVPEFLQYGSGIGRNDTGTTR